MKSYRRLSVLLGLGAMAIVLVSIWGYQSQLNYEADQIPVEQAAKSKVAKDVPLKEGDTILVRADAGKIAELMKDEGLTKVSEIAVLGITELKLASDSDDTASEKAHKIHAKFQKDHADKVKKKEMFAEPNLQFPAQRVPNDPWYANTQWGLKKINPTTAWDSTIGSTDTIIAVLDTGVFAAHPDLAGNMIAGWNWFDNNADTTDVYGHGTLVAGTASAVTNNATGVASICWQCKIMPIRVTDSDGYGYVSAMANGIVWAADHGARVANLSFQMTGIAAIDVAAQYLKSKNGLLVVSAGNCVCAATTPDDPHVITVTATDAYDNIVYLRGPLVDLTAPNSSPTTNRSGGYTIPSGTSISAPYVAGLAALVMSAKPTLTADQVQDVLFSTAYDLGEAGRDSIFGWGRIDASAAVAKALQGTTAPPPDTTAPTTPAILSVTANSSTQVTVLWTGSTDNVAVTGYSVFRDGVKIGTTTTSMYADTGVTAGQTYSYTIRAFDAVGNTSEASNAVSVTTPSPTDTTPPTAPADLSASATSSSTVTLSWTASTDNVGIKEYRIMRNSNNVATSTTTTYSDTGLAASTSYSYSVVATDAAGNVSTPSNSVSVTTPAATTALNFTVIPYVSVKTTTTATISGTTNVATTWSVQYGISSTSLTETASDTTSQTSHDVALSGLTPGKTYYFKVTATAADGQIVTSSTSSFKTPRAAGGKRK